MADQAFRIAFNGKAVDDAFYGDVVSVRVEEGVGMATTAQLRLATRHGDEGAWSYVEDKRLTLFTPLSVAVGFTGGGGLAGALGAAAGALGGGGGGNDGLEPVFDGYVTAVHVRLGSQPGETSIDVSGMDTSVLMSLEEKVAIHKDMSDSEIVLKIVGAYKVQVQADQTPTVHQERDTTIVQRGSDIQFVRDLARLNGMEFYFETDRTSGNVVAYFRAPQLQGTPQPDLAIQFGDESNLRRFEARMNGLRPLAVTAGQVDIKANSPNTAQVTGSQLAALGSKDANVLIGRALGSLVTPKAAQAQMLVLGPPTSNATEQQTIVQAVRDEASWLITAEGEINSEAYQRVLRPHRLVLVKGACTPYSGKYYVTRVVHELSGDGSYTQSFEARRNARDLDGSEKFGGAGLGLPVPGGIAQ